MMTNKRSYLNNALRSVVITCALAPLTFVGCDKTSPKTQETAQKETPKVSVYTLKAQRVPLTSELPGRVVAMKTAQVRPLVTEHIAERLFEEGSLVEKGQVLYKLIPDVYKAEYDRAEATRDNLQQAMDRQKELLDREATSQQNYDDSVRDFKIAQADFDLARINLERCEIKAEISGRIGFSRITEGALVTANQPDALAEIRQVDPIYVDVNPSVRTLLEAQKAFEKNNAAEEGDKPAEAQLEGVKVTLRLEDGSEYPETGAITIADNSIASEIGTLTLRAQFPNPNETLVPGMYVRATIEAGVRENGLLVPLQAIFRTPTGAAYVWVVGKDSKTKKRSVELLGTRGTNVLLDTGLEEGERVVVEGSQFIYEDCEVKAVEKEDLPAADPLN